MANLVLFPQLGDWHETRETLHAYSKVLGAIRGAFTPEHPKFWNLSLLPYTAGLTTTHIPFPLDEKSNFSLSLDLRNHYVVFSTSEGQVDQIRLMEGHTATALGDQILDRLADIGVKGDLPRDKFENDDPRPYVMDQAERYFSVLSHVARIFEDFKSDLQEETSPVQLWPHHFDLSFEVFGNFKVDGSESQIGIGFAPTDSSQSGAYFYANPYPFDEAVTKQLLSASATWFTDSWKGALLPYAEIAEHPDGASKLDTFLQAAYLAEKPYISK
ncbi:MAG: hypothetical protein DWG76_01555 [Chloroflexi bacterium]|nr:hypothetical protein [Chloroflexota bacterium]